LLGTMVQNQYIKQASTHMWGIINVYTINSEAAEHINKRQKQLLNKNSLDIAEHLALLDLITTSISCES